MFYKLITTIGVTVPIFVLATQTPDPRGGSDGIAIPLTKRSDANARKFHATSQDANIIHGASGMDGSEGSTGTLHPSAVQRDGSGSSLYLEQYMSRIWYGTISIGTPAKSFTVQLNTGFSDLFIPASTGDVNCRSHSGLWDPTPINLDLHEDFEIPFSDGRIASGKQYWDNVTIAGFTADVQTIGAATAYSSNMGASEFPADGILGLAFPTLSVFHGQSPLFYTLFREGKLSQPVFSLMLTTSGGELYIGGTNEVLYLRNTLVFTPVINPGLWELKIDNIQVNGKIVLTDVTAIIDTGTHFILGDPQRVLALHQAAGGRMFPGPVKGYYTFLCKSIPDVTFTIGGSSFVMPAKALNKGRLETRSRRCFSGIGSKTQHPRFWSIGTIFLQQFYAVFDFNSESPRIGFAEHLPEYTG